MEFIQKIERRWGRWATPHLTVWIVLFNALGYFAISIDPHLISALVLDRAAVMRGEVWRLVTYLFIPRSFSPLWIVFALYMTYLVGEGLEHEWGAFRFNLYYLIGMFGTTIIAFFLLPGEVTNTYLNTSLFLAFATIYPDFIIYLFLIIPVKVKWLGVLSGLGLAFAFIFGSLASRLAIAVSLVNYFVFFGRAIRRQMILRRQVTRARARFRGSQAVREDESFHCCKVCGKTEIGDPDLVFRVAQDGEEYCVDHLPARK